MMCDQGRCFILHTLLVISEPYILSGPPLVVTFERVSMLHHLGTSIYSESSRHYDNSLGINILQYKIVDESGLSDLYCRRDDGSFALLTLMRGATHS